MRMPTWGRIAAVAMLAALALSSPAWAFVFIGPFDFCEDEYPDNFVELRRGADINAGSDLGGTGHCAVNFTGSTGSAGDTWLTRYNGPDTRVAAGLCMNADILINKFNNAKGGGLVALLNTDPGDKGLFALLIDNGNTDRLTLNAIDPNTGKIVQLASVPLGSGIVENAWYRLNFQVFAVGDVLSVVASVRSHTVPSDPISAPDGQIGSTLEFTGSLDDLGLERVGFVGMAAWAKSAVVNTSITNFSLVECTDD